MPVSPSPSNIIKFITLLSPFMITSYLVLESFFRQDLRGIIFLAGATLVSIVGLISRLLFKVAKPENAHPGCSIFELSILELNAYSAPAFNTLLLFYTLAYLSGNMVVTGQWNLPVFITLCILAVSNIFVRVSLNCVSAVDIILGVIMGIIFGMLYFILIKSTQPKWTYFSEGPSDRQSCRRIGKTKFKCTIRKSAN